MKLHHLLQQEADELKRLLGAKAGTVGDQPVAVVEKSTRATLARLKTDLVSRRLHEAGVSTSEVSYVFVRWGGGGGEEWKILRSLPILLLTTRSQNSSIPFLGKYFFRVNSVRVCVPTTLYFW